MRFTIKKQFKKGDYIIGVEGNPYNITNEKNICIILEVVDNSRLLVMLIEDNNPFRSKDIGFVAIVESKYFKKINYIESNLNYISSQLENILKYKKYKELDNLGSNKVNVFYFKYWKELALIYFNNGILNILEVSENTNFEIKLHEINVIKNYSLFDKHDLFYKYQISYYKDIIDLLK